MNSALVPLLLEASLRALVAAVAVWAGLRLLGVGNVLVQKVAWGLVLVAALAMPLLPRGQAMPAWVSLRLPAQSAQSQNQIAPPEATAPVALAGPEAGATRYPAPVISTSQFDTPAEEPATTAVPSSTTFVPSTAAALPPDSTSSLTQAAPRSTRQATTSRPPAAAPQKHGWRVQTVLLTAEGLRMSATVPEKAKSKTRV